MRGMHTLYRLMQVVKDLWQKTLLEVHEHEDRCEINILQQQVLVRVYSLSVTRECA